MSKPLIKVSAALIFNYKNELLITQRPEGSHLAGYWEFPGGRVESSEKAQQALVRELKEETDLDIQVGSLYWQDIFEYDVKIIDISFYLCTLKDEKQAILNREIADHRWLKTDQLSEYQFPPADEALIDKLKKSESLTCRV